MNRYRWPSLVSLLSSGKSPLPSYRHFAVVPFPLSFLVTPVIHLSHYLVVRLPFYLVVTLTHFPPLSLCPVSPFARLPVCPLARRLLESRRAALHVSAYRTC